MNQNGLNGRVHSSNGDGHSDYVEREQEIDLFKLFNLFLLHKWKIISITFLGGMIAAVISLSMTPIFGSSGTIIISESKNRYSYAGSDLANLLTTTYGIGVGSTIANELQILQSYALSLELATRVLEEEFAPSGKKFPILWRAYPDDSTSISVDTVASRLKNSLVFSQVNAQADLVKIEYESPSNEEAAYIVNLTMDTYSALSTQQNRTMAVSALTFLAEEKQRIEQDLLMIEDSLRSFMNTTGLITVDPQTVKLINLSTQTEIELQTIEVTLVAINTGISEFQSQLDEIKPGLAEQYSNVTGPLLERLKFALSEKATERALLITRNPDIDENNEELKRIDQQIDRIQNEISLSTQSILEAESELFLSFLSRDDGTAISKISQLSQKLLDLEIEKVQYNTQKTVLQDRLEGLNDEFALLPDNIIRFAQLKRDVKLNEELFLMVSNQYAEMSLWEKTQFGLGRPLDYARIPKSPIKPQKKLITLIGLFLGGVFGLGFVFVRDFINDQINSSEEVKKFNKPLLGTIPDFKILNGVDPSKRQAIGDRSISNQLITFIDHISPLSEAYRRLRINVVYANPDKNYKVIMVTSATKGEGKSTVAANLAITFSESGRRVLLIDLDLRRPTQHKIFGENREPGLTDLLFETSDLNYVTKNTVAPNVDLITVGKATPEPASVLDSRK